MSKNTAIILRSELPESAREELALAGLPDLNIGDTYIDGKGESIYRISKIELDKKIGKISRIEYVRSDKWDGSGFEADGYSSECSAEEMFRKMERYDWEKIEGNPQEWYAKALAIISGEAKIEDYADKDSDSVNSGTAILDTGSKQALLLMQQEMESKRKNAELVARFVAREMEKKRCELDAIKESMYGIVASFKEKIKKIMRVITNIELYLGIGEELYQLQSGTPAPIDTPITFRQAVLYMDEEIGHYENGGLDYSNISWFDEWVIKDNNFKKLLPEEKGMVVLRPRRFKKDYLSDNHFMNSMMNTANLNSTYLLIRNGECFYRIFSEKIVILPRLFPLKNELQKMFDEMHASQKKEAHASHYEKERTKDKFEDSMYEYKQRAALMQGLIDRSEVFHPLPCKINIFNLEETKHLVNFVYDDEALLPSGRMSFKEWQKNLNSTISHGSRIMITGNFDMMHFYGKYGSEERAARMFAQYNTPPLPKEGIYDVELYKEPVTEWIVAPDLEEIRKCSNFKILRERESNRISNWNPDISINDRGKVQNTYYREYECSYDKPHLTIMYNPKDYVYGSWGKYDTGGTRKKSIRWKIFADDPFILHWDRLSADDIGFYLQSRVDRPNYLDMMPVLVKVKALLAEEAAKEAPFIQLLTGSIMPQLPNLTMEQVRERVVRCVAWWKEKNMIKRPIDKDDVLAIRMIEKRVTSKNYEKLKWEQ